MSDTQDGPELHPTTRELAEGPNFAAVTTMLPSGGMQTQFIWVGVEDDQIVLNTEIHRQKYRNIQNDPRITVCIRDEENPYRYAEVRGHVSDTTTGDRARAQIDELSQSYTGQDYPADNIKSERVILWITPDRQTIAE